MHNRAQFMKDLAASKAPKKLKRPKDVLVSDQWNDPGKVTKVMSGNITMKGVPYPVLGIDNQGNSQIMHPGVDYQFPGSSVTEYPQTDWLDTYESGGAKIYDRLGRLHSTDSYVPWAQDGGPTFKGAQTAEDSSLVRTYFNRAFNRPQPSEERYLELKRAIQDSSINLLSPAVKTQAMLEFYALDDAMKQKPAIAPKKKNGGWLDDYNI